MRPAGPATSSMVLSTVLAGCMTSSWCWAKYSRRTLWPSTTDPASGSVTPASSFRKRGLAGAVVAHQSDLLAALDDCVQLLVHHVVAVGLTHVLDLRHHPACARRLREAEPYGLAVQAGCVDALGLLQLADLLLHLLGLGVLGPEAADEGLGRFDLALLVAGGVDQGLVALALLFFEVVVVAGIEVDDAPIEVGDVGDHAVQEVAVVAYHHQGARSS